MLRKVTYFSKYAFGYKQMKKAFYQFLNIQAGTHYRGAPQFKQRKYINIQISDKFKQLEAKRKQQRLTFAQKRKQLLQRKLSNEAKLLTEHEKSQLTKLNEQVKSLQTIIQQQNKQLAQLDKNLQQTEADYILIEGPKKLVILNQIVYLRHMNQHPSGLVLTPQSVKVIENVHYLVTHNLPVPRYSLYQLMPGLFMKQIGELDQSVQKLIQQKNLNAFQQNTSHAIRSWTRNNYKIRNKRDLQLIRLRFQRIDLHHNLCLKADQIMDPHEEYIKKVLRGQTPFRNIQHCIKCITSDKLNLKLTEEQNAFKKSILEVWGKLDQFKAYIQEHQQRFMQAKYSYIEPPPYIANHPKLMQAWDKSMQKFTNPLLASTVPNYLPNNAPNDDGRAFMQQKIRKQVQKYDQQFVRLFNEDRQYLIANKKKIEIQFYNFSTRILQEYQALQDKSAPKEQFKKLPKKPKKKQQKYVRITMDQLTKMIFLNNKNKKKYNLDFFAKYFGMEQNKKDLFDMLNSISYLRVMPPQEGQGQHKQPKQEVLKFIG